MLQKIREKTSGWIAMVILGMFAVGFGLLGIDSYFKGMTDTYAARITLKPGWLGTGIGARYKDISQNDFRKQFDQERQRQHQELGTRFEGSKFDTVANKHDVVDKMVQRELLIAAAARDGITISDAQLAKAIAAVPAFQVNGKFDPLQYKGWLDARGKNMQEFEASIREDILVDTLPTEIIASGVTDRRELEDYIRLASQKRDLSYLDIAVPAVATLPSDAELQAWYQAHATDYRTQEQVALEYLELDAATIQVATTVDEQTLRDRYDQQKNRYIEPEQRLASHILINVPVNASAAADKAAQAKAAALAAQARVQGADFAALAKANSQDDGSKNLGGDLGWLFQGVIEQKAFASALYALKPGQISDPVRSNEGWHVIQLRDVRPGRQIPFETVRAELEKTELKDMREKAFNDRSGKLVDLTLKDSTSLAPAARELGMAIQKTPLFTIAGGPGVAADPNVLKAAFSASVLQDGNTSDPIEIGTNHDHMVVIRVAQHLPVKTLPLAQVRDKVLADVQADQRAKAAKTAADALLARAGKGESMDALASAIGGSVQTAMGVTRDSTALAHPLIDAAFRLPHPAPGKPSRPGLAKLASDHFALVSVTQVQDGDPKALDPATIAALRQRIGQSHGVVETRAYIDALRREFPVKIADERL